MSLKYIAGVELVPGWVRESRTYLDDIDVFEGDITSFQLPDSRTFDFVMMSGVAEHVQKERYECMFLNWTPYHILEQSFTCTLLLQKRNSRTQNNIMKTSFHITFS